MLRYCGLCLEVAEACFLGEVGSVGPQGWKGHRLHRVGEKQTVFYCTRIGAQPSHVHKEQDWCSGEGSLLGSRGCVPTGGRTGRCRPRSGAQVRCLSAFCFVIALFCTTEMFQ